MNKAQKNSVGLSIQIACIDDSGSPIDLTNANVIKIECIKPDGTSREWIADVLNLVDATIEYRTIATSDLDQSGTWNMQGYIEFSDGRKFHTTPGRLYVQNNIA